MILGGLANLATSLYLLYQIKFLRIINSFSRFGQRGWIANKFFSFQEDFS